MKKIYVVAVLASLLASGCSVRYGPRIPGFQPGYTQQQLGESTYQVKIGEAWPKDWADLDKFALYRAADITQERGQRYFQVLNASSRVTAYYIYSPAVSKTSAIASSYGGTTYVNAHTVTTPSSTTEINGGWYTLDFKVLSANDVQEEHVVDSQKIKRDFGVFIDGRR